MDKPYLRHQILKHKTLLQNLHSQVKVQQTLSGASNEGLNFVLKLLHFIASGTIKLPQHAKETIPKSLRGKKLSLFESKSFLYQLLLSQREEKFAT